MNFEGKTPKGLRWELTCDRYLEGEFEGKFEGSGWFETTEPMGKFVPLHSKLLEIGDYVPSLQGEVIVDRVDPETIDGSGSLKLTVHFIFNSNAVRYIKPSVESGGESESFSLDDWAKELVKKNKLDDIDGVPVVFRFREVGR